jgi:hypothetical protein
MRKTLFPGGQFAPAKVVNLDRRGVVSLLRRQVVNLTVFCNRVLNYHMFLYKRHLGM